MYLNLQLTLKLYAQGFYLPWALLALDLIFGDPLLPDILGMVAGHLYYFLTVLHPLAGGKYIFKTPLFVYPSKILLTQLSISCIQITQFTPSIIWLPYNLIVFLFYLIEWSLIIFKSQTSCILGEGDSSKLPRATESTGRCCIPRQKLPPQRYPKSYPNRRAARN